MLQTVIYTYANTPLLTLHGCAWLCVLITQLWKGLPGTIVCCDGFLIKLRVWIESVLSRDLPSSSYIQWTWLVLVCVRRVLFVQLYNRTTHSICVSCGYIENGLCEIARMMRLSHNGLLEQRWIASSIRFEYRSTRLIISYHPVIRHKSLRKLCRSAELTGVQFLPLQLRVVLFMDRLYVSGVNYLTRICITFTFKLMVWSISSW